MPGTYRGQERASDSLEVELKRCGTTAWVLRIEPRHPVRVANAINH